jgi:uncharacterized protein
MICSLKIQICSRERAMRKSISKLRMLVALVGLAMSVTLFAPSAFADALDDAKAAGIVGEKRDGYLGVVSGGADATVQRLVQDINLKRRDRYREIAQATPGSTLSDVEALAGSKIISQTPAGQYVQSPSGAWVQK